MNKTLFEQIRDREIPAEFVYEDDEIMAIRDINPQAPVHMLVIPKQVIEYVPALEPQHAELMGRMILVAQKIARDEGLDEKGYRLVINTGENAGQSVYHIHIHVLGGRYLEWPPG